MFEERTLIANAETDFRGRGGGFVFGSGARFIGREIWRKITGRRLGFGMACANFGDPLSLKAWSQDRQVNLSEMERPEFFETVEALGGEITERIIAIIPVLAVPVLSTHILNCKAPCDAAALIAGAIEICDELRSKGAHIGFEKYGMESGLESGLRLMTARGLLEENDAGHLSPVKDELALLQYYASSMIQLKQQLDGQ